MNLWRGWSGWRKPLGPSGLGHGMRCALALPACFFITVLESPSSNCSNSLSVSLKRPRSPEGWLQWVQDQQRPREGKGLDRGHSASWSEAELASGHRTPTPTYVLSTAPAPLPKAWPTSLSSYSGCSDFIFLPLTLSGFVASSSLYLPTFFREREIRNAVGTDGTSQGPTESWMEP